MAGPGSFVRPVCIRTRLPGFTRAAAVGVCSGLHVSPTAKLRHGDAGAFPVQRLQHGAGLCVHVLNAATRVRGRRVPSAERQVYGTLVAPSTGSFSLERYAQLFQRGNQQRCGCIDAGIYAERCSLADIGFNIIRVEAFGRFT